jgi:hypothetical protein
MKPEELVPTTIEGRGPYHRHLEFGLLPYLQRERDRLQTLEAWAAAAVARETDEGQCKKYVEYLQHELADHDRVPLAQTTEAMPVPEWFEDFWTLYPRKEGKKAARARWTCLFHRLSSQKAATLNADIMTGLTRWQASKQWAQGYVPWAQKFLRQELYREVPYGGGTSKPSMFERQRQSLLGHGNSLLGRGE